MLRTLLVVGSLVAQSACFVTLPPLRAVVGARMGGIYASEDDSSATRDPTDDAKEPADGPRITMEGIARIRERQRARANGVPMHEWSKSSDIPEPEADYEPTPPTPEQIEARDVLLGKLFNEEQLPKGFGDGLDDFLAGEQTQRPRV